MKLGAFAITSRDVSTVIQLFGISTVGCFPCLALCAKGNKMGVRAGVVVCVTSFLLGKLVQGHTEYHG